MTLAYMYRQAKDGKIYPYQLYRNLLSRMRGPLGRRVCRRMTNSHHQLARNYSVMQRLRFVARLKAAQNT